MIMKGNKRETETPLYNIFEKTFDSAHANVDCDCKLSNGVRSCHNVETIGCNLDTQRCHHENLLCV